MAEKPLAQRMADLENKMDAVLDTNKQVASLLKLNPAPLPHEWVALVHFCFKHEINVADMSKFAEILSGISRRKSKR